MAEGRQGFVYDKAGMNRSMRSIRATEKALQNTPHWGRQNMAGIGFQLVRGQCMGSVSGTDLVFRIGTLVAFGENATIPGTDNGTGCFPGLWIAQTPGNGTSYGTGAYVWAAYHAGLTDTHGTLIGTGTGTSGTLNVSWAVLTGGGGGGGNSDIGFAVSLTAVGAATGFEPADWGTGMVQELNTSGTGVGDGFVLKNRFAESMAAFTPHFFITMDGVRVLLVPGCNQLSVGT